MARRERTADDIDAMADGLMRVVHLTRDLAKMVRSSGIEGVKIHGDDVLNKHVPALTKWIQKAKLQAQFDIEESERALAKASRDKAEEAGGETRAVGVAQAGRRPTVEQRPVSGRIGYGKAAKSAADTAAKALSRKNGTRK